jgi:hypothetical protein
LCQSSGDIFRILERDVEPLRIEGGLPDEGGDPRLPAAVAVVVRRDGVLGLVALRVGVADEREGDEAAEVARVLCDLPGVEHARDQASWGGL